MAHSLDFLEPANQTSAASPGSKYFLKAPLAPDKLKRSLLTGQWLCFTFSVSHWNQTSFLEAKAAHSVYAFLSWTTINSKSSWRISLERLSCCLKILCKHMLNGFNKTVTMLPQINANYSSFYLSVVDTPPLNPQWFICCDTKEGWRVTEKYI